MTATPIRSWPRYRAATIATLSILLLLIQPGTARADGWDDIRNSTAEQRECVWNYGYVACNHARDAARWSLEVTLWKFGRQGRNDTSDAFRHCTAAGALATRVGERRATGIGQLHENHVPSGDYERLMDIGNNAIGARIGRLAVEARIQDTWGRVMTTCEQRARSRQLYGYAGIIGNY